MKKRYLLIIGFLTVFTIGCKKANSQSSNNSNSDGLEKDQTGHIAKTLKSFQYVDEDRINSGEQAYLMLLNDRDDYSPSQEEKEWYRNNITHVDSVCNYALTLLDSKRYLELQNLLYEELINLQSHPNADTYLWYDLYGSLFYLNQVNNVKEDLFCDRMISHLELLLIRTEAIQSGWDSPHPLYEPILNDLLYIYKQTGDEVKMQEIENKIRFITIDKN